MLPRWVLFGIAMSSLVMLTYGGVLLAFSIPVTGEMAEANPEARAGARAIVVPLAQPADVPVAADGKDPALLVHGVSRGSFPSSATDVRMGRAMRYVPAGASGEEQVGNTTVNLSLLSGGKEGWVLLGAGESEPWFSPRDETLGPVARFESTGTLALLLAGGTLGFITPLVVVIVTHRGARRQGAPVMVCRECRAPMPSGSEFCMRCGAWSSEVRADA